MAELGLAVVGVLPVIAASIKGLKILRDSVRTARKCIKHLDDIELNVETQQVRFLNECILLLRQAGKDEASCSALIANPDHPGWTTEETIEKSIRKLLGTTYDVCRKIVGKITEITEDAKKELNCFDVVREEKQRGESWKIAFQRRYQPLHFVFDKSGIKKTISTLEAKIDDLEGLRRQISQFKDEEGVQADIVAAKAIPPHLIKVRQISNEVYNALSASFKCIDKAHHEHQVSLGLDVEMMSDVSLKMALTYSTECDNGMIMQPPVRFILRSRTIWSQEVNGITTQSKVLDVQTKTSSTKSSSTKIAPCGQKRRKVAFATASDDDSDSNSDAKMNTAEAKPSEPSATALTGPTFDLAALQSPCQFLRQRCGGLGSTQSCPSYVASLKLPELSQHVFYISAHDNTKLVQRRSSETRSNVSLVDYLHTEPKDGISPVTQFKLALKLARAVLQYHSTPWLQEEWTIQQLQLMLSESEDNEDLPLYLSLKLTTAKPVNQDSAKPIEDVQMANTANQPLSRAKKYGIHNMALFCLGTALLEIGHWKSASELFDHEIDDNLVDTVRRLADAPIKLGKFYDRIVSKCLRCNFGDDTDLSRVELVKAVYEDVVCPLEDLVQKLDGFKI